MGIFVFAKRIAAKENREISNSGNEWINRSSGLSSNSKEVIRVHYHLAIRLCNIKEQTEIP